MSTWGQTAAGSEKRTDQLPVCVVLDTNIWRSSQLLSDHVSAALLYALGNGAGRIGLPEVVEREVFKHGVTMGRTARDQIEKNLRTIRALVGEAPGVELPSDEAFSLSVGRRLNDLEAFLYRVPFTVATALRALDRVDLKNPPAHAGQQYKDCVIWENCLDLAGEFDVHLVTADGAFYEQKNVSRGLEQRLSKELEGGDLHITLHSTLDSVTAQLAGAVAATFDATSAAHSIHDAILDQVRIAVERERRVLEDRQHSEFEAFVTEQPSVLSVSFKLRYGIYAAEEEVLASWATADGQCQYIPETRKTRDVQLSEIVIFTQTSDGISERRNAFLQVHGILLGKAPPVRHEVRAPLPGGSEFVVSELSDEAHMTEEATAIEVRPQDE